MVPRPKFSTCPVCDCDHQQFGLNISTRKWHLGGVVDSRMANGSDTETSITISSEETRYNLHKSEDDVNAAASVAMALGHRLRMQILCRVVPFGKGGLSAGTLSTQLLVVPSSLSFHLQQMTRAGVLTARHDGRSMYYSVNNNGLMVLYDFLSRLIDQESTDRP
jgi:ArsR family transcriptional regulator, arsenate/arsenite/antimonite-responsive transcriptional repressor